MAYTLPTSDDFRERFARDFAFNLLPGATGDDSSLDKVREVDITMAMAQAEMVTNTGLCESQEVYALAIQLLTAHFLALTIQASSQGLGTTGAWLTQSKSVEQLREAYVIPRKIRDNPNLAVLSKTQYGVQYLGLFAARLIGNIAVLPGETTP